MNGMYPEHEKMLAVKAKTEAIGAFLEWMQSCGYVICRWSDASRNGNWSPISKSIEDLLAEHFGIDPKRLEAEKRAMLEKIGEMHHDPR